MPTRLRTILAAAAAVLWACSTAPAPVPDGPVRAEVLHEEASSVGRVYVVEEGGLRYLRFDNPLGDDQSAFDPARPEDVPMDYVRLALASLAHADRVERVLMIGLGAGSFTTALFRALPAVQIDAVELSPVVARVAAEWFGLPSDPRYRIHLSEGRAFVDSSRRRWDAIFLDAYTEDTTPDLMQARALFAELRSRLRPGGVVLINLAEDPGFEHRALVAMRSAFGQLTCYETPDGQNLIAVGRADGHRLADEEVERRLRALASAGDWTFDLSKQLGGPADCPSG